MPYPISIAETYPILILGRETVLGPGHESAALAYLITWRVPDPHPHLISYDIYSSGYTREQLCQVPRQSMSSLSERTC